MLALVRDTWVAGIPPACLYSSKYCFSLHPLTDTDYLKFLFPNLLKESLYLLVYSLSIT